MTTEPTEFDKEMTAAKEKGKQAVITLKNSMDDNAPMWFFQPLKTIVLDSRTIPFLLGMGIEAVGIAVQNVMGMAAYPIIDVITVGVLILVLALYQRRQRDH